jgi:hypothetical protein
MTRSAALTVVFFLPSYRALEAASVHVDTEAIVNPSQQRRHGEGRLLDALRRHKGQDRVGDFVRPVRPAFAGHQTRQPPRLEGGLRLIERGPRDAERVGRARDRLALHLHPPQHFVLHLHEIPRIEEVV